MQRKQMGSIEFASQSGGPDGRVAVDPHIAALKAVASKITIDDFPFKKLSFLFRIDGEFVEYDFSGAAFPDVSKDMDYVSIDIGITKEDHSDLPGRIVSAIRESAGMLNTAIRESGLSEFDNRPMHDAIEELCTRYSDLEV